MDKSWVPQAKDLKLLPRLAVVAFAARCARRVQPLFTAHWSNPPRVHVNALEEAIKFAENVAASRTVAAVDVWTPDGTKAAVAEATRVAAISVDSGAARIVANNVGNAARAAVASASDASVSYVDARDAAEAAFYAAEAIRHATGNDRIHADFQTLQRAAKAEGWENGTPVPPEVFGPMWPDGVPPSWPEDVESILRSMPIAVVGDPTVLTDAEYAELVGLLGNLVRANGGAGITRVYEQEIGVLIEATVT